MATFVHESVVEAPLEAVWDFHATVEGLVAITPRFLDLRVESVRGPEGEAVGRDAVLRPGSRVDLSIRPLGAGPRVNWTSEIVERSRDDDGARFVDEMIDGPARRWVHAHEFERLGQTTLVRDRIEYAGPLGAPGDLLGRPLLELVFRDRHRRLRRALA